LDFDVHLARLQADFPVGKRAALAEIVQVRGRVAEATAVIQIGDVIGRIDAEAIDAAWVLTLLLQVAVAPVLVLIVSSVTGRNEP
jgi:hypothetical protein